jgi:hypothetical protein
MADAMSDAHAPGNDEFGEVGLPWLEDFEEEEERRGPSLLTIAASILVGLLVLALVGGGVYWIRTHPGLPAAPQPDAVEKLKPAENNPRETASAAGEGEQGPGKPNGEAMPQPPVTPPALEREAAAPPPPVATPKHVTGTVHRAAPRHRRVIHTPAPRRSYAAVIRKQVPAASQAPASRQAPPRKEAYRPVTALAQGVTSIQLGAYDNLAQARWVWKSLSGRFGYLKPLVPTITTVRVHGRKFYRLRAAGLHADMLCTWLRKAHETCFVVQ